MTIKQIIYIIGLSIISILTVVIIILSSILSYQNKQYILLKQEKNYMAQTIEKMKAEEEKKNEIYKEKDELLLEVSKSKTLKEYLIVWKKINEGLKK